MRVRNTTRTTPAGLIVLFLIYVILIGLILFFSQQILSTIQNINPFTSIFIIIIIVILPLILLGAIIINIIKLFREHAKKNTGARLKTRLIIFFIIISLLSLVPQAILSIRFVDMSINFWSNVRIIDVLEGGLQVALKYHSDKYENLRLFYKSPVIRMLLNSSELNYSKIFEEIKSANPEVNYLQIFDSKGNEIPGSSNSEFGDITDFEIVKENIGMLPKKEVGNQSILRAVTKCQIMGNQYYLVLGIILKKEFNEYASRITSSMNTFKQLDKYKEAFRIVVVIFYFMFSFPILLLSILISFLLTDEIIRPIVHLGEATKRVAEGDFSFRILTRTNDELSLLVDSFNKMVSELAISRRKIMQSEKISTWQEIAQRLAHEVTNPLTPIKLQAERILKKYSENTGEFEKILNPCINSIIREVDNLSMMLRQFKEFAKPPDLKLDTVNIYRTIQDVAATYEELSQKVKIDFSKIDVNINIQLDVGQVKQVFANLFTNSIQAMPDGGEIMVSAIVIRKGDSPFLRIMVKDTGCGIDDEIRDRIFDPYITTKPSGTGLGLSIVEKIVFDHNGNIWFESNKGIGTTFYIDLPVGVENEHYFNN
jgi:two-component system nitrogen regulation sensor histidine kinase NtrY